MLVNDDKKDIVSPLINGVTHIDTELIEIGSSNYNQCILSVDNQKVNGTHKIPIDENVFESMIISFEKINYTIGQTTNDKYYQKWEKIFSSCKQTLNKQILFDLSGIFTPGMNAILGMYYFLDKI
jgi:hypothetical protein